MRGLRISHSLTSAEGSGQPGRVMKRRESANKSNTSKASPATDRRGRSPGAKTAAQGGTIWGVVVALALLLGFVLFEVALRLR